MTYEAPAGLAAFQTAGAVPITAPAGQITFTGGSGLGLAATNVIVYTLTGRVKLVSVPPPFCTTLLGESGATATIEFGVVSDTNLFIAATNSVDVDQNDWWSGTAPPVGVAPDLITTLGGVATSPGSLSISENIVIACAVTNTNSGVLVFQGVQYIPLTSNGALALGANMVAV